MADNVPLPCPGCGSALQRFRAGQAQVPLERCLFCGGVWLDAVQIESLTGRLSAPPVERGVSTRRCASCHAPMGKAQVAAVEIEQCVRCGRIYLDNGKLEQLCGGPVRLQAASARVAEEVRCAGCGERLAAREAYVTARGLACSSCYARLDFSGAGLGVLGPTPKS